MFHSKLSEASDTLPRFPNPIVFPSTSTCDGQLPTWRLVLYQDSLNHLSLQGIHLVASNWLENKHRHKSAVGRGRGAEGRKGEVKPVVD